MQRTLRQLIGQAVDEGQQLLEGCHFLFICALESQLLRCILCIPALQADPAVSGQVGWRAG